MVNKEAIQRSLGNAAAIPADGRRQPDRRQVSSRWLTGIALTGATSTLLMGVALFAAMDGRQQLATPAEAVSLPTEASHADESVLRGARIVGTLKAARASDRRVMELSSIVKEGDREVVRSQPYTHVQMQLAAGGASGTNYPKFDPTSVLSAASGAEAEPSEEGALYGAKVETEIALKTGNYSASGKWPVAPGMSFEEIEASVRSDGMALLEGATVSAVYVDPERFSDSDDLPPMGSTAKVLEQNVSYSTVAAITANTEQFAEDVINVGGKTTVTEALKSAGYPAGQAGMVGNLLAAGAGQNVDVGDTVRMGVIQRGQDLKVVRASLYRSQRHQASIAVDDAGRFVTGAEPERFGAVGEGGVTIGRAAPLDLPKVYDGIYRSALNYGMTLGMAKTIVGIMASSFDLQAPLKSSDSLEAFYSSGKDGKAEENSELLYFSVRFGDREARFYKFRDPVDGSIGYFDENGKSLRQFLLRSPVPSVPPNSSFGMRRHPVLGFVRMHTGVDYPAPTGTPIIAAGDGDVIKAGWDTGGYGNQTLIRHANGYVSSYSHQSAIAKNVVAGGKVKQGQVIGYIGATGMVTGSHLHYELLVNGRRVDPLKIRLPTDASLKDDRLLTFQKERKRIDTLLDTPPPPSAPDT